MHNSRARIMDLNLGLPALDDDLMESMGLDNPHEQIHNDLFGVPRMPSDSHLDFVHPPHSDHLQHYNGVPHHLQHQQQQHPPQPHNTYANSGVYWPNNHGSQQMPQHHQQHFQASYPDAFISSSSHMGGSDLINLGGPGSDADYLTLGGIDGVASTAEPEPAVAVALPPPAVPTKIKKEMKAKPKPKPKPKAKAKPKTKRKTKAQTAAAAVAAAASAASAAASESGSICGESVVSAESDTEGDKPKKRRREKLTEEERDARKQERLMQRRMKKSEREKLRRNRENQLFDELADLCELGKDNRDKSSILAAVIKTIALEEEGAQDNEAEGQDAGVEVKRESGLASQLSALMGGLSDTRNTNEAQSASNSGDDSMEHTSAYMAMAPPVSAPGVFGMPTMPPPQSHPDPIPDFNGSNGSFINSSINQGQNQGELQQHYMPQNYGHQQHMQQHSNQQGYISQQGPDIIINNLMGPPSSITPSLDPQHHTGMQVQSPYVPQHGSEMTSGDRADMTQIFSEVDVELDNKFSPFAFAEMDQHEPSLSLQP